MIWFLSLMLFSSVSLFAQPAGYEHRELIILNSSQISGSVNHVNFPVMIEFTDAKLKSTSNGGGVTNLSGFDIIFTQSDGSTFLDHELQNYDLGNAFPEVPNKFALGQNFPNPFNDVTVIPFSIPLEANVSLTIFDVRGRTVGEILRNKRYSAGNHQLNWLAQDRSSGTYLYRVRLDNEYFTKKKILLQ